MPRAFLRNARRGAPPLFLWIGWCFLLCIKTALAVEFGNGLKIGEVTQHTAIIWTRLTTNAEMLDSPHRFVKFPKENVTANSTTQDQLAENRTLDEMAGRMAGSEGQVRFTTRSVKPVRIRIGEWTNVDPLADFTLQWRMEGLEPDTDYTIHIEGRANATDATTLQTGQFRTAPAAHQARPITFCVVACSSYNRRDNRTQGHQIYQTMLEQLAPDFFVHTGDIEYYDWVAPYAVNLELARFKWNRLFALPFQRNFHTQTASYFMKDDHDLVINDCWKGKTFGNLTFEQGQALFREQFPLMDDLPYRTIRWGQDLQIWLVEGRDYRSPHNMADGPNKTIWGPVQKAWFLETVAESNATFKVLISPTPLVGPDLKNRKDNHANDNGFQFEGDLLRHFLGQQSNLFVVVGDRHWQYSSVDPDHKHDVREFCCGPSSDRHARAHNISANAWLEEYDFLRTGGGFLSVQVDRPNNSSSATISFRHHEVNGGIVHVFTQTAIQL